MIFPTVIDAIETITIMISKLYVSPTVNPLNNLYKVAIATTLASVLIKAVVIAGEPS